MDYFERKMHSQLNRFHAEWADYLFPNTPIEVRIEEGKGCMLFFAVWEEGEWYQDCNTIRELGRAVTHLVKMDADCYWAQPCMRLNPAWPKWPQVSLVTLYKIIDEANSQREKAAQRTRARA